MTGYTEQANAFIQDTLIKEKGIGQKDIVSRFVPKGKQVIWPELGEDGKPHLVKKTFK